MRESQAVLAWSGGKDAAWSLHRLRRSGTEVVALLSTLTRGDERASMQGVRREVLHAQARAAGVPLVEAWIEPNASNAAYEVSLAAALARCRGEWPRAGTLAFGDLFLRDVRDWRAALCDCLGWQLATPLFDSDTAALAHEMIDGGLRANLCCVDTTQLAAHFLGTEFTAALLGQLPADVDPCGENGEFHTCVYAGPMFDRPLPLVHGAGWMRDGRFAYADYRLGAGP
ncbi:MAG TPA: ATP-binding protein [Pseudoxanthomonas sp.]|nr:ATP-binding protein [Pseudoxanthomonas sp.]